MPELKEGRPLALTCFPPVFTNGPESFTDWPNELTAMVKLQTLPAGLAGCQAATCGLSIHGDVVSLVLE